MDLGIRLNLKMVLYLQILVFNRKINLNLEPKPAVVPERKWLLQIYNEKIN
jgi:hypothetical protein